MNANDYKIAKELKRRLAAQAMLVDFRVFGSRARGDAENESDMDVFVEVESLNPEVKEKIHETTWSVGFENSMVISPLIVTRYEVEQTALRSSAIIRNITREGIAV
ncbi:MAG: nucleotidyltransferase domain-containing protein [Deltaproteobacteria bacterium]|nr:nucleotidyltransferase domain-containing protein [Deltaproteobacteria bacterium]